MAYNPKPGEFCLTIDAYTPTTIPMARLAAYMTDYAVLLGNEQSVHFGPLKKGSTVLVARVEREAEPKVRERLHLVRTKSGNDRLREAAVRLDDRLAEDNAKGVIADSAGAKIFEFPGRDRNLMPVFGPIQQPGTFQGIPIKIGGENDPVPVHLEDGKEKHIVLARRSLAKEIAGYLFTEVIRVEGEGSWTRTAGGVWEMKAFHAHSMRIIQAASLSKNIGELRSIESAWKQSHDPLKQLDEIRHG